MVSNSAFIILLIQSIIYCYNPVNYSCVFINHDKTCRFAQHSAIHSGSGCLYKIPSSKKTIAINAGHGTRNGVKKKVLCHPDGSKKVKNGSTSSGTCYGPAITDGWQYKGCHEKDIVLLLAHMVKEKLLCLGYNVLMLRDGDDVQLDNIARTVMANKNTCCHVAIHVDSTNKDKGAFVVSIPKELCTIDNVALLYEKDKRLDNIILYGLAKHGISLYGSGHVYIDLTQAAYSTIPFCCVETGDIKTIWNFKKVNDISNGIVYGINKYVKIYN